MSFVAIAIGGSAAIGAGASIYGASQQSSAAKKAANVQQDALNRGMTIQQTAGQQALSYLDPFRQYGLNAGNTLQGLLYSPAQLQAQAESARLQLQSEIDLLTKKNLSFEEWRNQYGAQYTGGKGYKRSRTAYSQYSTDIQNQLSAAQSKLETINKQAELQQRQGAQTQDIEASPWYQFQAQLLGRDMDRYFAARGLTGSGFESEQRQRSLIELGAGETERQFNRLKGLYDVGANAASVGAGSITGTAQSIANSQAAAGQAQAQGYLGVAGANANAASGVANAVTGAVGAGLNYAQFQNLINMNQPKTAPGTVAGATTPYRSGYESTPYENY
jgi:hypothetical protein